ncbi:acyltransferase [Halobacteriovorax sp. ZH5_bin.2]|uniref:acyltransferase n=1 Tax=Halobacteriovorax sp. ZH5_bin.2 TaxID=3157727 RepID=UPI00371E4A30
MSNETYIHPTAIVEEGAEIGENTKIWHFCHIRAGAKIGDNVSIGRDCYVDSQVTIGSYSRIQNGVSIYNGVTIDEYCFVGPHVIFTNDQSPRVLKKGWEILNTKLELGASLGAGSIIRCGVQLGRFTMIGAGSVVTKNTKDFSLHLGLPSVQKGYVCACGDRRLEKSDKVVFDCCVEKLPDHMIDKIKKDIHE